jgi:hypothetical protein
MTKTVHGSGQREVERTQAAHRHDIAREHQESVAGDGKTRRERIQSKDQIRRLDHDQ